MSPNPGRRICTAPGRCALRWHSLAKRPNRVGRSGTWRHGEEPVELVGLCGFKGRPDAAGSVEIGYSILGCYQRCGYATEAVGRLVGWAFSHHNVNEVCAETLPHLRQSIGVLEKNGFRRAGAGSEAGVIRYAITRNSLN